MFSMNNKFQIPGEKMEQIKLLFMVLSIMFAAQNLLGQAAQSSDTREEQRQALQQAGEFRDYNNRNGDSDRGFIFNRRTGAARTSLYKGREKEISNLKKAFERTKNMLVIAEVYYEKYKSSLKDKKVHLARLQPDRDCYGKYVVSVEELEKCSDVVPVSGGGSMYSFRLKLNYPLIKNYVFIEDGILFTSDKPELGFDKAVDWWNIHFTDDRFAVQNSSVRGVVAQVGNVDLESITLTSKELDFLNNFKPKNNSAEIKEQNEALKKGISSNNFVYFDSVPVELNSTYVLRSIDYRSVKRPQPTSTRKQVDKRADMTIAFKVVGRENDGSVIILWKELKVERLSN